VDPYVGNELDVIVRASLFSGRVGLLAGTSVFFAGSYLEDFDLAKDAYFFFVSVYEYVCVCVCMCMSMYVYVCVCVRI